MAPSPGRTFKPKFVHGSNGQWSSIVKKNDKKRILQDQDEKEADMENNSKLLRKDNSATESCQNNVEQHREEKSDEIINMDMDVGKEEVVDNFNPDHDFHLTKKSEVNAKPVDNDVDLYGNKDNEPFMVYVESLPGNGNIGNIHPLAMGKKLFSNNIDGVAEVKRSGKNRVICNFQSASAANRFVRSNFGKNNNLNVYIPKFQLERLGLIRNIDTSLTEAEILENLNMSNDVPILSVKRLNKLVTDNEGNKSSNPIPIVSIKFRGKQLPEYVSLFYNRCFVEPYISNPIICYNCIRFGHTSNNCKSQIRCPNCANCHMRNECDKSQSPTCLFCKGPHSSLSKSCPEYAFQRKVKEVMAYRNISYREALIFLNPKSGETESYSKVVGTNYKESFPSLPPKDVGSHREKLPLPPSQPSSKQALARKPPKVHQNVTLFRNSSRRNLPSPPKFTSQYYKNFNENEVPHTKPVYMHTSNDASKSPQETSDLNVSSQEFSIESFVNTLSLYKKDKISIDKVLDVLRNFGPNPLFPPAQNDGNLSDSSF
jgi:hypothetical protein